MIKGNKGEWSEIYALLKLLGDGKIYAADENVRKIEELYFPILKIIRAEEPRSKYEYTVADAAKIKIFLNGTCVSEYDAATFSERADELYRAIVAAAGEASFPVIDTETFINRIGCTKLKAPPVDIGNAKLGKTDITMQIHDPHTGHQPISGFSIKSELGHAPTLLNASGATNFIFEVSGLDEGDIAEINAISTRTKIIDRISAIKSKCSDFSFVELVNENFDANLEVVDSKLAELLSYALFYYYSDEVTTCAQAVEKLISTNPMSVRNPASYYPTKFKKFLTAIALGMVPAEPWDGRDEAAGGYILVTASGDVLAYHIYNRDSFEEYLLRNTKFERGSTTRHGFASLYAKDEKIYINLNMQIRFIR